MGWTLPWDTPVVLVGAEPDVVRVRTHLQRIGWDNVVGRIEPDSLVIISGGGLATTDVALFSDLSGELSNVVDVRDPVEQRAGVIPRAKLGHIADVAKDPNAFAAEEVLIHCQGGYRAAIAAGFLEAAGAKVTVVYDDLLNYEGPLVAPTR
jgi:rhodanese-related sulfurtransferase